jgi:hypothetical protein
MKQHEERSHKLAMRILRLLILWIAAIALVITIYSHGQVRYYWYANDNEGGRGYSLKIWQGTSLDDSGIYPKGFTYRYWTYQFEKNTEIRAIAIILILAGASFLTLQMFRRPKDSVMRKEANT